jgi:hypothetical protein
MVFTAEEPTDGVVDSEGSKLSWTIQVQFAGSWSLFSLVSTCRDAESFSDTSIFLQRHEHASEPLKRQESSRALPSTFLERTPEQSTLSACFLQHNTQYSQTNLLDCLSSPYART